MKSVKNFIVIAFSSIFLEHSILKNIKTCEKMQNDFNIKNNNELKELINVNQYLSISILDIISLSSNYIFSVSNWKKRLHCRYIAVSIYEFIEDFSELLGKKYRDIIKFIDMTGELMIRLDSQKKELIKFKNQYFDFFKSIRNYVGAHKDKNANAQMEIIKNIDLKMFYKTLGSLIWLMFGFMNIFTDIIIKYGITTASSGQS